MILSSTSKLHSWVKTTFVSSKLLFQFKTARAREFIPNSHPQGVFEFALRTKVLSDLFFRKQNLSIRLWLPNDNFGLRPQIGFLSFFSFTFYIASAISMLSFLPGLPCCSCGAPYVNMSLKPRACPMSSRGALLCIWFWFQSSGLFTHSRCCAMAWAGALKPHNSCYQLPRWLLEYFHLFTIVILYYSGL